MNLSHIEQIAIPVRELARATAFYRDMLGMKLLFEVPPTHAFEVGRFREETMAFPPGVTVKDYGHLLAQDPAYRDKAAKVSSMTRDLSEVLFDEKSWEGKGEGPIAFQSPCTLQHGQQVRGKAVDARSLMVCSDRLVQSFKRERSFGRWPEGPQPFDLKCALHRCEPRGNWPR